MFACEILRQFAYGFTIPLLWAMMADVADFSEWKTGRRATAIVFSAIVFALKAGLGFGGAITGYVLSLYGYVPNVAQGAAALDGIRLTMSVFPAITFAICAVCLFFYSIDKRCRDPDDGRAGRETQALRGPGRLKARDGRENEPDGSGQTGRNTTLRKRGDGGAGRPRERADGSARTSRNGPIAGRRSVAGGGINERTSLC